MILNITQVSDVQIPYKASKASPLDLKIVKLLALLRPAFQCDRELPTCVPHSAANKFCLSGGAFSCQPHIFVKKRFNAVSVTKSINTAHHCVKVLQARAMYTKLFFSPSLIILVRETDYILLPIMWIMHQLSEAFPIKEWVGGEHIPQKM
jgi:hypothetical protein